jgi:hypothetical protein
MGEVAEKESRKVNIVQKMCTMYVNAKMIPVETVPETERGEKGECQKG